MIRLLRRPMLLRLPLIALAFGMFGLGGAVSPLQAAGRHEASELIPGSAMWREIRQGDSGFTNSPDREHGNLINAGGEDWRQIRNGPVSAFGRWIMGAALLAVGIVFLIRGRIRVDNGFSGETVERWTPMDRIIHWLVAVLFVVLSITGLSFLYGKAVLLPWMGADAFAAWAALSKTLHNYGGPLFIASLVLMIAKWLRYNNFNKVDAQWLAKGGGIVTKAHPSAEYLNAGEKLWFWMIVIVGAGVSITGLILDFPNFNQTRETMQQANILHAIFALSMLAVFIGHVYIATLGTEGALEGMVYGQVDVEWAKQHHDLWYEEVAKGTADAPVKPETKEPPGKPATT